MAELRTPLNAIGGYADLITASVYGTVNADQDHAIGRIVKAQLNGPWPRDQPNALSRHRRRVDRDERSGTRFDVLAAFVARLCRPRVELGIDGDVKAVRR